MTLMWNKTTDVTDLPEYQFFVCLKGSIMRSRNTVSMTDYIIVYS